MAFADVEIFPLVIGDAPCAGSGLPEAAIEPVAFLKVPCRVHGIACEHLFGGGAGDFGVGGGGDSEVQHGARVARERAGIKGFGLFFFRGICKTSIRARAFICKAL